jgi:hypothetical protein
MNSGYLRNRLFDRFPTWDSARRRLHLPASGSGPFMCRSRSRTMPMQRRPPKRCSNPTPANAALPNETAAAELRSTISTRFRERRRRVAYPQRRSQRLISRRHAAGNGRGDEILWRSVRAGNFPGPRAFTRHRRSRLGSMAGPQRLELGNLEAISWTREFQYIAAPN